MKKIFLVLFAMCCANSLWAQDKPASASTSTLSLLGNNIITLSPGQLIPSSFNSDKKNNHGNDNNDDNVDICVSLAYEHVFKNQYFSVKLPVSCSVKDPYFYFMPALKLYPFKQGIVKYAISPQFLIAAGEVELQYEDYSNGMYVNKTISKQRTQLGFMISHSLNITILKSAYIGLELGLGINYYDTFKDDEALIEKGVIEDNQSPVGVVGQMNFNFGYRF